MRVSDLLDVIIHVVISYAASEPDLSQFRNDWSLYTG